jgi:NDP-sugar pyrophosphorylase family protein
MNVSVSKVVAVVLAGGFGTRVQHLLPNLPKPMAAVAGKPFLEWVVRYLANQGVKKVVISTGYLSEVVARHFHSQPVSGVITQCVAESGPLGTAGGFLHAARASGEDPEAWLVWNGDSLAFVGLEALLRSLASPDSAGVVVGKELPDTSRYGTLSCDSAGGLVGFAEKQPGKGIVSAGIYVFRDWSLKEFPGHLPLSFEKDVFPALLARQMRLQVHLSDAPFLDVGTPETLPQAEAFIRMNERRFNVSHG